MMKRKRAMWRRSSAKVFGGNRSPSGVQSSFRRSGALRSVGLKLRIPKRTQACFHPIDDARAFAHQVFALAGRAFGVFLLKAGDRRHSAMLRFTPQPGPEGRFEQFGIEPISLRSAMLSRDCNACRMNDVGFNA